MSSLDTSLNLQQATFGSNSEQIITCAVPVPTVEGKPHDLEAVTVLLFDGPHLDRLDLSRDVRVDLAWPPYGKLQEVPRSGASSHIFARLARTYDRLQQDYHWGTIRRGSGRFRAAEMSMTMAKWVFNMLVAESVSSSATDALTGTAQARGIRSRFSGRVNDLGFYEDVIDITDVGDVAHLIQQHPAHSLGLERTYDHIEEHHDFDVRRFLEDRLTGGIQPQKHPQIIVDSQYLIPAPVVDQVLSRGDELYEDDFDRPNLVMYVNIPVSALHVANQPSDYRVISITKAKGHEASAKVLELGRPDYRTLIEGTSL